MLLSYVDQLEAVARRRKVSLDEACAGHGVKPATLKRWRQKKASPAHATAELLMRDLMASGSYEDFMDIIADLRDARTREGVSQLELDARAGFTDGHVAKYESGARTPHSYSLFVWALSLGLSLSLIPTKALGAGRGSYPRPEYKGTDLDERIKAKNQGQSSREPA